MKPRAMLGIGVAIVLALVLNGFLNAAPIEIEFGNPFRFEKQELLEVLIAEFNASQDEIRVINLPMGPSTEYDQKLVTLFVAGMAPHVVWGTPQTLANYIYMDAVVPIDAFLEKDPDLAKEDFLPTLIMELTMPDGRLVGIPFENSNVGLLYNIHPFEEVGAMTPAEYAARDNWTWETFIEAMRKVTRDFDGDGQIDQHGFLIEHYSYLWFTPLLWQNGGAFYTPDFRASGLDSPAAIEAAEFFAAQVHDYGIARRGPASITTGEVVMRSDLTLNIPAYQELGYIETAPLPEKVTKATVSTSKALGISRNDPAVMEAAWTFIKWLVADERFIEGWLIPAGYLPVTNSGVYYPVYSEYLASTPLLYPYIMQLPYARKTPILPSPDIQTEGLDDLLLELIIHGDVSPAAGMRAIAEHTNAKIRAWLGK